MSALKRIAEKKHKEKVEYKVTVTFERDLSPDSLSRSRQARELISQMILNANKKGRPSTKSEEKSYAA